MSKRSRAAAQAAARQAKEEQAAKRQQEKDASSTRHLSKYAAKKLAQAEAMRRAAASGAYDDDASTEDYSTAAEDTSASVETTASAASSSSSHQQGRAHKGRLSLRTTSKDSSGTTAKATMASDDASLQDSRSRSKSPVPKPLTIGTSRRGGRNGNGRHGSAEAKPLSKAAAAAVAAASKVNKQNIRSYKVDGNIVLRAEEETESERVARLRRVAQIADEEAKLPANVREQRAKRRQRAETIQSARVKALQDIEARGETYQRPSDTVPEKAEFKRHTVLTFGIATKDRMPDLNDPLERAAALAPHNRRDSMLFAPIKRHNKPFGNQTDFMVKFLAQWSKRNDKGGIFSSLFQEVIKTRREENSIAYVGLPAFLKFLEGKSKRDIINDYAFEFRLYIKRREITDFIATMQSPALAWMAHRPYMDQYYAFVYFDTHPVRMKLGKKRVYVEQELFIVGVTLDGRKDLIGIVPDFTSGRLSVDFWQRILQQFKLLGNRGICFMVAGFKCRYLERAVKQYFPETTLQFNLLEVLQFDSFQLPDAQRKLFMTDAADLCEAPNFEVAKAKLELLRHKWEPHLPAAAGILQGNVELLHNHTLLPSPERKIFTTNKMVASVATLLLGAKGTEDFFSDHAEMLNYFFYRYLLIGKQEWLEHQDEAIYNQTFSHLFALLRHCEVSGAQLLNRLLTQQHQDFMQRHFGSFGSGPVFNLNPNRRKISLSGKIEPHQTLQQLWADDVVETADPLQVQAAQEAEATALLVQAQQQEQARYEQERQAAKEAISAAAAGAAQTAATLAQATEIEATARAALGGESGNSNAAATSAQSTLTSGALSESQTELSLPEDGADTTVVTTLKLRSQQAPALGGSSSGNDASAAGAAATVDATAASATATQDAENATATLTLQQETQHALQPRVRPPRPLRSTLLKPQQLAAAAAAGAAGTADTASAAGAASGTDAAPAGAATLTPVSGSTAMEPSTLNANANGLLSPVVPSFAADYEYDVPELTAEQFNSLEQGTSTLSGLKNINAPLDVVESKDKASDGADSYSMALSPAENTGDGYALDQDNSRLEQRYHSYTLTMDMAGAEVTAQKLEQLHELASLELHSGSSNNGSASQGSKQQSKSQPSTEDEHSAHRAAAAEAQDSATSAQALAHNAVAVAATAAANPFAAASEPDDIMQGVSSNIQSANAVLGTLKPSIAQALREDRELLKANERQQIYFSLGHNFNFDNIDNVIQQVTPIFRASLQTRIAYQAEQKKLKEQQAKDAKRSKERARYLKRQAQKQQLLQLQEAQKPINIESFTGVSSIQDLAPQAHSTEDLGSLERLVSGTSGLSGSLSLRANDQYEVDFAKQQLSMQPLGAANPVLQAASMKSSIKVAPQLMSSLMQKNSGASSAEVMTIAHSTKQQHKKKARPAKTFKVEVTQQPNLLQLSEHSFGAGMMTESVSTLSEASGSLFTPEAAPAAVSEDTALPIEKTADFKGPVAAPEVRSLLAERLAQPGGVRTAEPDDKVNLPPAAH